MNFNRRKAIFFLILSGIGMILLALGIPGMQLQPGLPIPGAVENQAASPVTGTAPLAPARLPFWSVVREGLAVLFVVLLAVMLFTLLRHVNWKRVAWTAAGLFAVLALLFLLPHVVPAQSGSVIGDNSYASPPPSDYAIAPIGSPPQNLYGWVIALLLLAALVTGAWLLRQALRKPATEPALAREMGAALQAISDGQDLNSVIIRCYLNMAQLLKDEQGLEREETVTPREFEEWLAYQGVPDPPIHQLTRLFEKARYSSKLPDERDEQAAVECLTSISDYSRQNERRAR